MSDPRRDGNGWPKDWQERMREWMQESLCPGCGKAGVVVGLDSVLRETRPNVRPHACGVGGPGSTATEPEGEGVRTMSDPNASTTENDYIGDQIARVAEISSDQAIENLVATYTVGRRTPFRNRCRDAYAAERDRRVVAGSWDPRSPGGGQR